ncbi:MAG: NUDIX hydrolase [Acidimicrobiales bacterium]
MVEAAGGVVWRRDSDGALQVLIVHRDRYDDWSFPKGKLDRGETHEAAAQREVAEETGLRCALGAELPEVRYDDRDGRPKRVRYWAMQVIDGAFAPNDEVDEVRWLPVDDAAPVLTYARDVVLLDALVQLQPTV